MTTPDFLLCDVCGIKISKDARARVYTREYDINGDKECVLIDMCSKCWARFVESLDLEDRCNIAKSYKKKFVPKKKLKKVSESYA